MTQVDWQHVTPQYDEFVHQLEQYPNLSPFSFTQIQHRFRDALTRFARLSSLSRVLLVNAPDNAIYRQLIIESLNNSISDNNQPVIRTESLNAQALFDQVESKEGQIIATKQGLLSKADNGFLIVSANLILANPGSWLLLKSALLGDEIEPITSNPDHLSQPQSARSYNIKLLVVGDRGQMGDLDYLDSDIRSGFCLFSEIEQDLKLNQDSLTEYLGYLKWLQNRYQLPDLTVDAVTALLSAGAREAEDQTYTPLCPIWHNTLLSEAAIESDDKSIDANHIEQALIHKYQRESYLPERALDDILDGQVIIETQGEQVGQVNGLTVIDVPGHPISYGEPARISCVIHFGDGDISDVERKAELGGNLHAKGMMIMQAFVSASLNLEDPLPYSASVVFEQSYCEVDGDSASLAELCSLVSALSEYPINQQIAVTGAVDQFGRVQAVGGLNEKIEGFYHVCKHQGLTGEQGVILPHSNLKHLALMPDVVDSIKNGEFHIWSVSNVDEAIPLIMNKPFRDEEQESVLSKIAERIENFERHEHPPGIVERIKNWFV
ncbi:Lon protease family protein [Vibrio sp. D404a]|uniref:Lon protease family protein n=1 Tax=unclassified Vibrio TaxID=2614977 RepID=UPI002556C467|nr:MULTISPECIES: Lon protease family protein [unclassified Vibrio]MDK9735792.1 Lon protease family protein [Vibrio sp. D404a]MDK9796656.1 Lon protease family protein [Vibrio sp. D449a]